MKQFFSAIGETISDIWTGFWNLIFRGTGLIGKFVFWLWALVLVTILVVAISVWFLALGVKSLDGTELSQFLWSKMNVEMTTAVAETSLPDESSTPTE